MMGRALAEHYLAHRKAQGPHLDTEALTLVLDQFVDAGKRAWPGIELEGELIVAHLAERCPTLPDPVLRAPDLFLACGCAHGVPAAIAAFEAGYLAQVPAYLARGGIRADIAEEVRQLLGDRLLVGARRRIVEYQGRGSLANWVRAAATRTALNLLRSERRHDDAAAGAAATGDSILVPADPELDFIKARFRPQFKQALREAMSALASRDRAILRLHYGEGIPVGQLAVIYGVHRATASRWLNDAQRAVLDETRALLRERLKISPAECDQLVGLVQSRLDVTLSSLLRTATSG
jgi:RNA polymerase sigma-70 factor (ECF subfamily)